MAKTAYFLVVFLGRMGITMLALLSAQHGWHGLAFGACLLVAQTQPPKWRS